MEFRDDILPEELTQEQSIIVERIMQDYSIPKGSGTYLQSGERMRQLKPAKDIDGFTDLVMRVIVEQQNSEGIADGNRVRFLEDFPPDPIETEIITFGLLKRTPASMSQGPAFNQRVQEMKPHVRSIDTDETRPGYKVVTLGQKYENMIVLTCWAKTNKQANRRARWLEDTMKSWTWYLRYNGIDDCFFDGQDEDIVLALQQTENVLHGRPLRYYVRTERLTHVLEPTIRRIVVRHGLQTISNNTE